MSPMPETSAALCSALAAGLATFLLTTATLQHTAAWAVATPTGPLLAAPTVASTAAGLAAPLRPRVPLAAAAAAGAPLPVESTEGTPQAATATPWALLATLAAIPVCVLGAVAALRGSPAAAAPQRWGVAAATAEIEAPPAPSSAAKAPAKIVDSMQAMLTPLGYYEAYELLVVISNALTEQEVDERLSSLEAIIAANQCKKVRKADRGRRLLAYPIRGRMEAYMVVYTFKGPRFMPKLINGWFVGPGLNSDGNVFRCFLTKQRRLRSVGDAAALAAAAADDGEGAAQWKL